MAGQTSVKLIDKQFKLNVKRVARTYRIQIFDELARAVDAIRLRAATDFIIPNIVGHKDANGKFMSRTKMYKMQPTNPTRLTSRTGLLISVLKEKTNPLGGAWKIIDGPSNSRYLERYATRKSATLTTGAFKGIIKADGNYNGKNETYTITLRTQISSTKIDGFKVPTGIADSRLARVYKVTPQQLVARFFWDLPSGIKGRRRPFIEPSSKIEFINTSRIIQNRIRDMSRIL